MSNKSLFTDQKLTHDFIEKKLGWERIQTYPLFAKFQHPNDPNVTLSLGIYGHISIKEKHWCNHTTEKEFTTINASLTEEDLFMIFKFLHISHE